MVHDDNDFWRPFCWISHKTFFLCPDRAPKREKISFETLRHFSSPYNWFMFVYTSRSKVVFNPVNSLHTFYMCSYSHTVTTWSWSSFNGSKNSRGKKLIIKFFHIFSSTLSITEQLYENYGNYYDCFAKSRTIANECDKINKTLFFMTNQFACEWMFSSSSDHSSNSPSSVPNYYVLRWYVSRSRYNMIYGLKSLVVSFFFRSNFSHT